MTWNGLFPDFIAMQEIDEKKIKEKILFQLTLSRYFKKNDPEI